MDRFSKICLSLIVALLGVIAMRPLLAPQPVHAAAPTQFAYYDIGTLRLDEMSNTLANYSKNGWAIVGVTSIKNGSEVFFVFAK
jgi:hypothetical protein